MSPDTPEMSVSEPSQVWDLKERTKLFALRCIKLVDALPKGLKSEVMGRQLLGASTSVGANYRTASLVQFKAAFTAKLSIVLEEADESVYWLELIVEAMLMPQEKVEDLHLEAQGLTKVFAASRKKRTSNSSQYASNHYSLSLLNY
jgi:four helix bundle protein